MCRAYIYLISFKDTTDIYIGKTTNNIKDRFKEHKKDFHSRRGLQALVNKRRKLLKYLKQHHHDRYADLIQQLGLRDSY